MGKLKNMLSWPRRYRTSRGFGVHSPFAFNFITKVLRDRSAYYYAFPEIDSLCGKTHRDSRIDNMLFSTADYERQEARMLFRILCHFRPDHIVEVGGGNEVSLTIFERAVPKAKLHRWSRERFDVIDAERPAVDIVNYALDENLPQIRAFLLAAIYQGPGRIIFFRNMYLPQIQRLWEQITSVVDFGMTFHDDLTGIFVAIPGLPRQDYPMLL